MTNFIQPIDAGLGRTVRISIGHFLDQWLMDEDNMERWESSLTAGERRIISVGFVGQAMRKVMSVDYDNMRVGCFERTGCLMTIIANEEHDKKIRPQGMDTRNFTVPSVRTPTMIVDGANNDENENIVGQDEEAAALQEEQTCLAEQGDEEGGDYELDDGGQIDDNPAEAL